MTVLTSPAWMNLTEMIQELRLENGRRLTRGREWELKWEEEDEEEEGEGDDFYGRTGLRVRWHTLVGLADFPENSQKQLL